MVGATWNCCHLGTFCIPKLESAQKAGIGEENYPAAPTTFWSRVWHSNQWAIPMEWCENCLHLNVNCYSVKNQPSIHSSMHNNTCFGTYFIPQAHRENCLKLLKSQERIWREKKVFKKLMDWVGWNWDKEEIHSGELSMHGCILTCSGSRGRTPISSGFSREGTLTSASTLPRCGFQSRNDN